MLRSRVPLNPGVEDKQNTNVHAYIMTSLFTLDSFR